MRIVASTLFLTVLAAANVNAETTIKLSSDVPPIALTAPAALPENPLKGSVAPDDYCAQYVTEPDSPGAKLVAANGWLVTSEADMGPYRVVSFVGDFSPKSDGNCYGVLGRVAVFDKSTLVALAVPTNDEKGPAPGRVDERDGDSLLVERLAFGLPVGELHQDANGIRLTVFSASQGFCHGAVSVPNIYGVPIRQARKSLIAAGWKPIPGDNAGGPTAALQSQGVVEAAECSENFPLHCPFLYRNGTRTLTVITHADKKGDPTRGPVDYTAVTCQ
jgi:hypothetical protein